VLEACGVRVVDRGHGHGIDRYVGAAVESAEKEAATDALKRCAKSLGMRLGLALYDKAQEHVAEPALTVSEEEQEGVVEQWPRQTEAWKRLVWPTLLPEMKQRIKDLKKESAK
jgi:recombination DNA repair RAD52 pathway protein